MIHLKLGRFRAYLIRRRVATCFCFEILSVREIRPLRQVQRKRFGLTFITISRILEVLQNKIILRLNQVGSKVKVETNSKNLIANFDEKKLLPLCPSVTGFTRRNVFKYIPYPRQ